MASRVDAVVRTLPAQLAAIDAAYKQNLAAKHMTDDLLHNIARLVEDFQRVLDWTATDLDHKFGQARDRSPYFPLSDNSTKFAAAMMKDFPTVRPDVHAAVERHQPYQPGKHTLGYLRDLARVNKHQDFTPQTRTVTPRREVNEGGVKVSWSPEAVKFGSGVKIAGLPVNPKTQLVAGATVTETIYVDWLFAKQGVSVLATLTDLANLVTTGANDIRQVAGL